MFHHNDNLYRNQINLLYDTEIFSEQLIKLMNQYNWNFASGNLNMLALSKSKLRNYSLFFRFILLLSGDINLNPGPPAAAAPNHIDTETWSNFKQGGLHFIHLNINSLLPKIDELRQIAIETNAAIIGITESKLDDDTVLDAEIEIEGYSVTRSDRNRHGGGVVCYIRDSINYNLRPNFYNKFENIVLDLLLPDTKPILIGIFYNPPNKTGFETFNEQEVFFLGDFNINLLKNNCEYFKGRNFRGKKLSRQFNPDVSESFFRKTRSSWSTAKVFPAKSPTF